MSTEDKLVHDVDEVEDSGALEVYVRFNDDMEKDYCFQIKVTDTFSDLFKIFDTLPISLRPSVFYHARPAGFQVSTAPGYLTHDGALLFDYNANKPQYLKAVSLNDKISAKVWPGQLIVPKWEHNDFGFYAFVSFLLVWLYTDLPDFISPTPGICLTNQVSKLVAKVLTYYGKENLAKEFVADIEDPAGIMAQCVFFIFHIIKVAVIFLFLYVGVFNPIKVLKFMPGKKPKDVTRDQLLAIGWTGSKRATPDEYKEHYRNYRIKQYKSMVEAHQDGLFDKLRNLGAHLKDGEGFNTPLDSKTTLKDLASDDNTKFTLSYSYLTKLGELFENHISQEATDINEAIKEFRRFGLLKRDDTIGKIVAIRRALDADEK